MNRSNLFSTILGGLVLVFCTQSPAGELIARSDWPQLQRGIQVSQYPVLARIVAEFDQSPDHRIVVMYPGGEAGHNWAVEIQNWLVALGIPSRRIALEPGSGVPDTMRIEVETSGLH